MNGHYLGPELNQGDSHLELCNHSQHIGVEYVITGLAE